MNYYVHLYALVRVKVGPIEADSQTKAMERAIEQTDLDGLFHQEFGVLGCAHPDGIEAVEYADEIASYLVDEAGDEEYVRSQAYNADMEPEHQAVACPKCGYRGPQLHTEDSTACRRRRARLATRIRRAARGDLAEFSNREIATMLAALRFWQETVNKHEELSQLTIATDDGELDPLNEDEIDELCEKVNCEIWRRS